MTLNNLNLILVLEKNRNLFLQTTFYVPRIDYRNAGFKVNPPDKSKVTEVEVYIKKDVNLPDVSEFICLNPIVHSLDLGSEYVIKNGKINGTIKVTMYELISNPAKRDGDDEKKKIDSKETDTTTESGETP